MYLVFLDFTVGSLVMLNRSTPWAQINSNLIIFSLEELSRQIPLKASLPAGSLADPNPEGVKEN